ncbi:MAG TPA: histidine kinase [Longimicrobiales bacterium]
MTVYAAPIEKGGTRWRRGLVRAGVILGACLALATVETTQTYVRALQNEAPIPFTAALGRVLPSWVILAVLAPAVLWVSDRYPLDRSHGLRHVPAHVITFVLFTFAHLGGTAVAATAMGTTGDSFSVVFQQLINWYFIMELLTYGAIVGVHHALRYHRDARERELAASELRARLTRAQLQALRNRLDPHFLYNTLNAVSALALRGEREAVVGGLSRLREILDYSLDDGGEQDVPLSRELEAVDLYLEIQRLRYGERMVVEKTIDPDALDALVPRMIMQPLAENAVLHGVARRRGPVRIEIAARAEADALRIRIRDTGPGFGAAAGPTESHGIGLANTRARLEQRYGDGCRFEAGDAEGGGGEVVIRIPLQRPGGRAAPTEPARQAAEAT